MLLVNGFLLGQKFLELVDKVELVKSDASLLECLYEGSWVFADHTTDLVYDIYGLLLDDGRLFAQQDHLPVGALEVDLTHLLHVVYIHLLVLQPPLLTKELLLLIFNLLVL